MGNVITFTEKDMHAMANRALELLMECAKTAIAEHGHFVLVLAGGNTPKMLYSLLKDQDTDFSKWFLVYGDERCLPANHPDRNSVMVQNTWLNAVKFPATNHYVIPAEEGAIAGAIEYSKSISHLLPADFALLGIGEDGHTAGLFPQNLAHDLESNGLTIATHNSPKPPAERISLSYKALRQTSTICFMASGENKRDIIKQWQKNPNLPCNRIHSLKKTLLVTDIAPE